MKHDLKQFAIIQMKRCVQSANTIYKGSNVTSKLNKKSTIVLSNSFKTFISKNREHPK